MTKLQAALQSETMRKLWQDPAFRESMAASRQAKADKMKALWANPEYRARVSAAVSKAQLARTPKNAHPVVLDGVSYSTINQAVRATGMTRHAIKKAQTS